MHLGKPVEPAREQDLHLLDIALAPAAVARSKVDDGRRRFFVGADNVARDFHAPTGAAEEGGFDKVVAQDLAAERFLARQVRQGQIGRASCRERVSSPV